MTKIVDSKRLDDDELKAVAGGVTAPTIDPSLLSGLTHATVGALVGGGGAYTMSPHTDTSAQPVTSAAAPTFADAHFASTATQAGSLPAPSAQTTALVHSIYDPTPGQAPAQMSETPPPHVANPNQLIGAPANWGLSTTNKVGYNIYE